MKQLLILGAGTAGTMVANHMVKKLPKEAWQITIVDQEQTHFYQPGFLFMPFGVYGEQDVVKPKKKFIPEGVTFILAPVDRIETDTNRVLLEDGRVLAYDYLVIATGSHPVPAETPGLEGPEWQKSIFDFYTFDGAKALQSFLKTWTGGRLVLNVAEMPIKCPVAPLEFLFLADWFFTERGIRDKVELVYATPLPGAFTKPKAAELLGHTLAEKGIIVEKEFNIERVEQEEKAIYSYDERRIPYDLLITVPVNMGADVIERSGLGDDLNYVPTDKHTLLADGYDNIFVLGDATNLPASKAGSVAHFQAEGFAENFVRYVNGGELEPLFDGHANCYIETGFGKGLLIDFNYDTEPLPGSYPLPGVGPFSLLKETRMNHLGKMAFKWIYWNMLLKARPMPISAQMSMMGKVKE